MKDIETVHKDNADLKKLRVERRLERTKQMVVPDASTADFERQLKKLATRGGEIIRSHIFTDMMRLHYTFFLRNQYFIDFV